MQVRWLSVFISWNTFKNWWMSFSWPFRKVIVAQKWLQSSFPSKSWAIQSATPICCCCRCCAFLSFSLFPALLLILAFIAYIFTLLSWEHFSDSHRNWKSRRYQSTKIVHIEHTAPVNLSNLSISQPTPNRSRSNNCFSQSTQCRTALAHHSSTRYIKRESVWERKENGSNCQSKARNSWECC